MIKTLVNANDLDNFGHFFDQLFGTPSKVGHTAWTGTNLPVDITERDNVLRVKAAIPGVSPENLDVTIDNRILTIKGQFEKSDEDENTRVYRREYSYGEFKRSIRLPENIQAEKVEATFKNGFVTISIPLHVEEKPGAIRIPVKGE